MSKFENKSVSKSAGLAGWLEDFIKGLASKNKEIEASEIENQEEEKVTTAEINVRDLQKVIWNDETFYVNFTDNGANILNEFGNTVQTLEGVKTIEEVDQALNSQQIVAENVEDDLEIIEGTENDEFEEALNDVVAKMDQEDCENEEKTIKEATEDVQLQEELEEDSLEDPILEAIIAGFGELENKIAKFEEKLAIVEQMYARLPKFEDVDSKSQDEEVKHFTETADQTSTSIINEQKTDISTPHGRVELSQKPKENVPIDEKITSNELVEVEKIETTENTNEETEQKNDSSEEKVCEDCGNIKCTCDDEKVEKLSGVQEKIFQNGICPITGESLVKSSKKVGDFIGVYSPNGGTEYAVNLNNGEIFRYLG